jgi:MFS transporter, FSR family, fosmidomycin resistance protein
MLVKKPNTRAWQRNGLLFVIVLYGLELLDELIYGLEGAALPHFKASLALTYTQVGLLLSVPGLVGVFTEPLIGLLGDTKHRRAMVRGGILMTALGLALVAWGQTFPLMLLAFTVLSSASGAYVNLAQGTLIDRNPSRAEQTMARWVVLGSIGVTLSPLIATAAFYAGYGWRTLYWGAAGVAGVYIALLWPHRFSAHAGAENELVSPRRLWQILWQGLKNRDLLRWMVLTELADLMLDRSLEVTGLYFHDVVGVSLAAASAAVAWASMAGLAGSIVLVPLIERVKGLRLLRVTSAIVLIGYPIYLLVPVAWVKYALLGLISFCTASWFPTLQAKNYETLPGQSGLVMAVGSLVNLSSLFVPFVIGRVADTFGLAWAMWLLALGPLALLVGLPPREAPTSGPPHDPAAGADP